MHEAERMVREFQQKVRSTTYRELTVTPEETFYLKLCAHAMIKWARLLEERGLIDRSPVALRAHLMLEELGEALDAMADGDELKLLDGLCDTCYVVIGTATAFRLPISAAFEVVHKANMTKTPSPNDTRVRDKGGSFVGPEHELRQLLLFERQAPSPPYECRFETGG